MKHCHMSFFPPHETCHFPVVHTAVLSSPPGEEEVVKYLLECRADVRLGIVFRLGCFFGWDWHLFKLKLQVFIRIEAWIKLKNI